MTKDNGWRMGAFLKRISRLTEKAHRREIKRAYKEDGRDGVAFLLLFRYMQKKSILDSLVWGDDMKPVWRSDD